MSATPDHFRLHKCEQDSHYHVITSSDSISCPFWTWAGGMMAVDLMALAALEDTPRLHFPAIREEITKIKDQLWIISDERFKKIGHRQNRERFVAEAWSLFMSGLTKNASYPPKSETDVVRLPFICDFVNREGAAHVPAYHTDHISRRVLEKIACQSATPRTVEGHRTYLRRNEQRSKVA